MKTSSIILLLVILFLIYCFQHRNNISRTIESFYQVEPDGSSNSVNFLPPVHDTSSPSRINVPYCDIVGGAISSDNPALNEFNQRCSQFHSYTNNFMFTPIHKTKSINSSNQLVQRTYVLSVECKNVTTGALTEPEVEIWIFGLNKGRRHYVDQSYQDFKSISVTLAPTQQNTSSYIELRYQPQSINTEYVAIRFDNNIRGTTVRWIQPQLEVFNSSSTAQRRSNFTMATPYMAGLQLYKKSSALSESGFVEANALAVNKFCNLGVDQSLGQTKDLGALKIKKNLTTGSGGTDRHYVHPRINSYFPTLDQIDNYTQSKHFEHYIQVDLHFILEGTGEPTSTTLKDLFKNFEKTFTNNLEEETSETYYNKNLYGYLKKMYYNNDDRLNVTDINFSNEVEVEDTPPSKFSKLKLGDIGFICSKDASKWNNTAGVENSITNLLGATNTSNTPITAYFNFRDSGSSASDGITTKEKIVLPLNIYFNSPKTIDSDLDNLKTDIFNFMKNLHNSEGKTTRFTTSNKEIVSWDDDDARVSLDDNKKDHFVIIRNSPNPIQKTIKLNVTNCSIYNGDRSQCTAMATEVTGIGSQIQECACTRCTNNTSIHNILQNGYLSSAQNTDMTLFPGHGNPVYFCHRKGGASCSIHNQDETNCNDTPGCSFDDTSGNCNQTCQFKFPPNYSDGDPPEGTVHNLMMTSGDFNNTYNNNFEKHHNSLSQNSCQLYKDNFGSSSNVINESTVLMNHFRNCNVRFDSNGRPLDLCLQLYPFFTSGNSANLFSSKYRGKKFIWYKKVNDPAQAEVLHHISSGAGDYFINISQTSANSFKNYLNTGDDFSNSNTTEGNTKFQKQVATERIAQTEFQPNILAGNSHYKIYFRPGSTFTDSDDNDRLLFPVEHQFE